MKHSVWLLLACSLAGAIPLHKGGSWTWLVVDRETNARNWRSAAVLDSAKHDSGFVWRIQARDSLTKGTDTGSILVRPDGSQSWMAVSKLLPWEPGPLGSGAIGKTFTNVDTLGPLPWGIASLGPVGGTIQQMLWTVKVDSGLRMCGYDLFFTTLWLNCPEHLWDDSVGVLRVRFHGGSQEDWILRSHNGKTATIAPNTLATPEVGATLVWIESTRKDSLSYGGRFQRTEGPYTRTWKILERPADSGDWVRVRILETLRSDSSSRDSAFDLRMNALTGERIPVRGKDHPTPDEAWRMDWTDSDPSSEGILYRRLRTYSGGKSYRPSVYDDDTRSWMKIGPENQIDSLAEIHYHRKGEGGAYPWDSTIFTRVLLSVDGKVVRSPDALGVGRSSRRSAPSNLSALARLHPSLVVSWRDASGRSGQILARDFGRSGFGSGNGVLFLSAILPDGSRWTGSALPTMR